VSKLKIPKIFSGSQLIKKCTDNPIVRKFRFSETRDVVELSVKKEKSGKIQKLKARFREYKIGLNKSTIHNLEKLPVNDFLLESRILILKSMGIPKELWPSLTILSHENKKSLMMFDFAKNEIFCNTNSTVLNKNRREIFSCIRHELEHFKQNLSIIRTEKLGERAVNNYAKLYTKAQVDNFVKVFKDMSENQIAKLYEEGQISEASMQAVKKLQTANKQGDKTVKNYAKELYHQDLPIIMESWKNIRAKAIELMGTVKENSEEGTKAKQYFKEFLRNKSGKINANYYKSSTEREASLAQMLAHIEYLGKKFFS